jgi:hypothetical protein
MEVDGNGWAVGAVFPLGLDASWALLSPSEEARVDLARWAHQARTFFSATLEIRQHKKYPEGRTPRIDAFELDVARKGAKAPSRVVVTTFPLADAPSIKDAAEAAVRAIGGAGFDALLARARRVWQVDDSVDPGDDDRAPLAVAAVLASALLAPIVPPGGGAIFGVKGARERLARRGWT